MMVRLVSGMVTTSLEELGSAWLGGLARTNINKRGRVRGTLGRHYSRGNQMAMVGVVVTAGLRQTVALLEGVGLMRPLVETVGRKAAQPEGLVLQQSWAHPILPPCSSVEAEVEDPWIKTLPEGLGALAAA
jgi:hypothetical protein